MVKGLAPKLRWNKKRWFHITAPKLFNEEEIGNTIGYEPKNILGRTLKVNASTLLNDPRKQTKKLTFKINEVNGDKARTVTQSYELTEGHIKRMIRKNGSRIDVITNNKTKDSKNITLKTIVFSSSQCTTTQRKNLRSQCAKTVDELVSKMDYDTLIQQVLSNNIQKEIKNSLKKIHPLKFVEVLKFKLAA